MNVPSHHVRHPMKPVYDRYARVLILGSMPGGASLAAKQYYAHPKNQFWSIMGELVGAGPELTYEQRLRALRAHHIALWDVMASCERRGSLDAAIRPASVVIHPIAELAARCPDLCRIGFNGKAAERYYRKYAGRESDPALEKLEVFSLPSTSPAYAVMRFEEKLAVWRAAVQLPD